MLLDKFDLSQSLCAIIFEDGSCCTLKPTHVEGDKVFFEDYSPEEDCSVKGVVFATKGLPVTDIAWIFDLVGCQDTVHLSHVFEVSEAQARLSRWLDSQDKQSTTRWFDGSGEELKASYEKCLVRLDRVPEIAPIMAEWNGIPLLRLYDLGDEIRFSLAIDTEIRDVREEWDDTNIEGDDG